MVEQSKALEGLRAFSMSRICLWLVRTISFGGVGLLIVGIAIQFVTPGAPRHLQLVQDVALPTIVIPPAGQRLPQAIRSDRFDFQALDPQTGLLFIAHPGPSAAKLAILQELLPANTQFKTTVVVFNTRTNQYVGSLAIPFVHGITVASALHRVYAADADESKIYVIDESTCKTRAVSGQDACRVVAQIKATQTPDGLEYDPALQEVFVAEPGDKTPPEGVEDVIDAQTNKIIQTVHLGTDVGHTRYDPVSHRIFVIAVTDKNSELVAIEPSTGRVGPHTILPAACNNAHGLILDSQQQVAFAACVDSQNLVMIDMRAMKVIGDVTNLQEVGVKPDILAIDHGYHLLYVASSTSISIFDEREAANGILHKVGDFIISSSSSHTIAVDDTTHNIFIALTDVGGRPIMRVERYNP
ncbi:MAG TPA: YncE family protein [Ktedonosporobacter sp.]|jgi:DNA-binding beta-propeller fold protein YncE|nr:YncE family protein [Ktedonosporobacter sp.]